jgi:VWFA-related protein
LSRGRKLRFPRHLLAVVPLVVLGSMASPSARIPGSPQKDPVRFSVDVNAVALDVVVTDRKGKFVKGLKRDDFVVLEEGVPQELTFFTAEATPVTVLVLLDSSASVRANLKIIQKAANRFIDKLRRGDKARVGFFHNRVIFGPSFTDDMDEHIAMIRNMRPQRSTHLYDALIAALQELAPVRERKSLLVFTDGDDEGSNASREDALEAARRSDVSIYGVGYLGWSFEDGMNINEELLSQLSKDTGGRAFFPMKEKEIQKAFDRIRDELHRQYRMAYFPGKGKGGDSWRKIDVRLKKKKNLVVRTRLGYFSHFDGTQ